MRLYAARPATYLPNHAGDDAVPRPEQLSEDRFVLPAPGRLEAFEETANGGLTLQGARLYPRCRGHHFGVRDVQLDEGVEIATVPGLEPASRNVHGLVRHRRSSIHEQEPSKGAMP